MSHLTLGLVFGLSMLFGCSGSVVFVEGEGGDGGASDGGFDPGPDAQGASPPTPGGAPPVAPSGGGGGGGFQVPQTECGIACDVLFQCGLQPSPAGSALCPGFESRDQEAFSDFCVPQCESLSGATSFIDGEDCPGTIETVYSVSATFAELCNFGF